MENFFFSENMIELFEGENAKTRFITESDLRMRSKGEPELNEEEKKIMSQFLGEEQLFEKGENPPSWVADESIWKRAKEVVRKTYGTLNGKYGVVVHVYRKMGGKEK